MLKLLKRKYSTNQSIGYHNSDFSESKFKIYYNKRGAVNQYPLNISSLDELKNTPKSISVVSKELGTTFSQDKVIIAHKEFDQQSVCVSKEDAKKICSKWDEKFVDDDEEFNSLSYEDSYNDEDGSLKSITLFAYKNVNKNGCGKKKSPSVALIAGVAAAAVAVVIFVVVVVVVILKRRKTL